MVFWAAYWHRIIKDGTDTSITKSGIHYSSLITATLKPATEWTGVSECMILCTACAIKTRNPKVIWEQLHSAPHNRETNCLQRDAPRLPPKLPLPLRWSPLPSNTLIPRLIPLTTLNGIHIQSAVLSQTHGISNRPVRIPTYTLLYYSDTANNNNRSSGMYADYVVWGGQLGGPVDDLWWVKIPEHVGANVFWGDRTKQCNV